MIFVIRKAPLIRYRMLLLKIRKLAERRNMLSSTSRLSEVNVNNNFMHSKRMTEFRFLVKVLLEK